MSSALDAHVVVARDGFALDVELSVPAGGVVAVMGPSGAGKSTLLGALAGLVRPSGGSIRVGDRVVDDAGRRRAHVEPMRRDVVLLGQEPRLFPHLTAAANVAFALRAGGAGRTQAREEATAWLDRVGLAGMEARRPVALSGGQQQRVALARALAAAPAAILLDEPLSSLDAETAAGIRVVVAEQLAATRTTAVVVTHDAVDAVALADRLVIVERGAVTQRGAVRDVLARPATRFAAAVAGVDRLEGVARRGAWACGAATIQPVDAASVAVAAREGAPLVAIVPPGAVRVQPVDASDAREAAASPGGFDVWLARVARLESTLGGVRVVTSSAHGGATVSAELPAADAAELRLAPGASVEVWVERRLVRLLAGDGYGAADAADC
ncbi:MULTISPECIES: sulfate/molybdate ABC transporter ATP-binding protein [unclassified Agrococcus]|uniref:sulfate/molybdate ABC transporter ATP-binding protein n=1 Tax=unclassified Agrococcus TaxID=2615065 RepID=UPI0036176CAE